MNLAESVIRTYYAAFNERRVDDAVECLAPDALLDQRPGPPYQQTGPRGYREFVAWWLTAFPDATLTVQSITSKDDVTHDVELLATGTHIGALEFAGRIFRPTDVCTTFRMRELLQIRDGLIAAANLSFDFHEIVRQLTTVDRGALLRHLERLGELRDQLTRLVDDGPAVREAIDRIGRELDLARHVVRPYFR